MLKSILEKEEVKELLGEIFNNPKYYQKNIEEVLKDEYFLQERVLFLFYDALYKYKLIIEDDIYFKEFINGFEALLLKLDNIEDIKFGVTKLIGKLVCKKLNISKEEVEDKKNDILEYVYDRYVRNGYYIRGLSRADYNLISKTGVIRSIHLEYVDVISDLLKNYGYNLYDNYQEIEFNTDFSKACLKSVNAPSYLYNLVIDNKYITKNKEAYYLKDEKLIKNNLDIVLKELGVIHQDRMEVLELFKTIWDYFNSDDNNIYLVLVKRSKLKSVSDFISKEEFTFLESLDNIFNAYDDFEARDEVLEELDYLIELPSYGQFIKKKKEEAKEKIQIDNEYGKISIVMIIGIILIILGVFLSLLLV